MRGRWSLVTDEPRSDAETALIRADIGDLNEVEADARRALIRAALGVATCVIAPVGLVLGRGLFRGLGRLIGFPDLFGVVAFWAFALLLASVPMLFVVDSRWRRYKQVAEGARDKRGDLESRLAAPPADRG